MLYIVSTPIGNLQDITLRALEVLKTADLIAAEDTRHTRILTSHYGITTPTTSYFEHNQMRKGDYLLGILREGKTVALVTDAGTPGISDPGFQLIRLARENGIPVTVIPGPCALVTALSASGLPSHSFIFEGFLPVKDAGRRRKLETFQSETRTVIFYESPHRVVKTLTAVAEVLDNPPVVCARELTKKFEEIKSGPAADLAAHFQVHPPRGEFVLLLDLSRPRRRVCQAVF